MWSSKHLILLCLALSLGLVTAADIKGQQSTQKPHQASQQRPASSTQKPKSTTTTTTTAAPHTQDADIELQDSPDVGLTGFYNGMEKFSLDMLTHLGGTETNVAFSPLTTWILLSLMSEGSRGTTLQELRRALVLPQDTRLVHQGFGNIRGDILRSTNGNASQLEMGSAAFTSPYQPLKPDFERIAESYYNTTLETVNFRNRSAAARRINSWVNELTRGHISSIVGEEDLKEAKLVLASALYFRGAWKEAFNESQTRTEPFFDEEGQKIADVDMMYLAAKFRMSFIERLASLALELPYASGRNSMLLLLPRRGSTVADLLERISNASQPLVADIMKQLREDEIANDDEEDIHVYLPRFALNSQLKMSNVLRKMGIRALFQDGRNELPGLSSLNLYVSELLHKATITVNEEGTVAAAASAAVLHIYSLPSTFKGNRPFVFLIVQKATNTILFAGKVGNPDPSA